MTAFSKDFIYSFAVGLLTHFIMEHINKIEIQGRVGTVRANEFNGSKVVNFSVVTDYLYKTRDGAAVNESTWHNVVAWESRDIKNLDMIEKGIHVNVTGRLRQSRYTSSDGTEKQFYEILAYKVQIVSDQQD